MTRRRNRKTSETGAKGGDTQKKPPTPTPPRAGEGNETRKDSRRRWNFVRLASPLLPKNPQKYDECRGCDVEWRKNTRVKKQCRRAARRKQHGQNLCSSGCTHMLPQISSVPPVETQNKTHKNIETLLRCARKIPGADCIGEARLTERCKEDDEEEENEE